MAGVRKKYLEGSFTIEAALLTSMILFIMYGIIISLFFYHDKNILTGAVYETAEVSGRKQKVETPFQEEEIENLLRERLAGKLILFRRTEVEIKCQKNYVWISVQASAGRLRTSAQAKAAVTEPEKKIRDMRKLEKAAEQNI